MCMYMLHIFTIHVRPYTCIRMRRKLQRHEWYREVQIHHGLRMLMERMEEKLLQSDSRWFFRLVLNVDWYSICIAISVNGRIWYFTSSAFIHVCISGRELLHPNRRCIYPSLCYEAFHGFVSSYRIKKSYPKVNSSSPRGQLATRIQKREQLRVMMVS